MAYSDFTLDSAVRLLDVSFAETKLFPNLKPASVPSWLPDSLQRGRALSLVSEKSRSEFIVAPILLAARELANDRFMVLSGQRLDVDAKRGLTGECDFILAITHSALLLRSPILALVEAKKHDIEAGLGQCIAQMIAARTFNENEGRKPAAVFGCVTTGEDWQFLKLVDSTVELDGRRLYLASVAEILGTILAIVEETEAKS